VNHLGHFLLTNLLLEKLKSSIKARIINVSSQAQRMGHIDFNDLMAEKKYSGLRAYCQAKLANIIFTKELARRLKDNNITVNVAHPGTVRTNFGSDTKGVFKLLLNVFKPFMRSPEKGAETIIYLAGSNEVSDITGKYFADMKEKEPILEAHDKNVAKRLWEVSCQLTGLN
jgi:NAD(P)-dependent dehydrogenase (short-subunit alcohol dehydrogenase family)